MIEFLRKLFSLPKEAPELGALLDTRLPEEKEKDYHISEIVAGAAIVTWVEKDPSQIRTFGVQNQDGSGSCVAQSRRKLYRILFWVNRALDLDFSATFIYRLRKNYPDAGMQASDAISLSRYKGLTLNALMPSDNLSEMAMNGTTIEPHNYDIAKVFTIPNEVTFTAGDLFTPAGTIQKTRKGIMMWFFFTAEEWGREVPVIIDKYLRATDDRALRHSVVGVEPAMYRGEKGIWIEDSAHFGGLNRRFITERFYKARNYWASYPINFVFESQALPRPFYDGSTVSLQDCLKYEGTFPANVDSTGVFGSITKKAVQDFQIKYGLDPVGTVGPLTTKKLQELYPL